MFYLTKKKYFRMNMSRVKSELEEWEEEDILVYAELEDNVNLVACRSVHVLGIGSEKPVLQLDDNFFQGEYSPALGTYMFLEPDNEAKSLDPLFDKLPEKNLKYVCKTGKVVNFSRVYLHPKEGGEFTTSATTILQNDNTQIEEFESMEQLVKKFEILKETPQKTEQVSDVN